MKIYFWLTLIFSIIGLFPMLKYAPLGVSDVLGVLLSPVFVVATYAYGYRKAVFNTRIWRVFLAITLFLFAVEIIELYLLPKNYVQNLLPLLKSSLDFTPSERLGSWFISMPAIYCLYKLSFKK